MEDFKYEVAFSLLSGDESIGALFNDRFSDKVRTFFYPEREREIAGDGRDGMDTFSSVFANEARLVVVLYRDGWGKSKWTTVEETAIKGRVFNEGWENLLIVKLDKNSTLPVWVPKTYQYLSFHDFEKCINVIEYKIGQLGGDIHIETIEEFTKRHKRDHERAIEREEYLKSTQALQDAKNEFRTFCTLLTDQWNKVISINPGLEFEATEQKQGYIEIGANGFFLKFMWHQRFRNVLTDSFLSEIIKKSVYKRIEMESVSEEKYFFTISETKQRGWADDKSHFTSSHQLIDEVLKKFIKIIKGLQPPKKAIRII